MDISNNKDATVISMADVHKAARKQHINWFERETMDDAKACLRREYPVGALPNPESPWSDDDFVAYAAWLIEVCVRRVDAFR